MAKHTAVKNQNEAQAGLFMWERPGMDFPLYNDATLAIWQPIVLIVCALLAVMTPRLVTDDRIIKTAIMFLGTLVPFLVVSRGNIGSLFKRPRWGDIPLVIVTYFLTVIFSMCMGYFLMVVLGVQMQGNAVYNEVRGEFFYQALLVQLFGEEMFKIDVLLGVMTLAFRRTGNRKTSVLIAIFVTMFLFGIAHLGAYNGSFVQILLIQGLGSIFNLFCYLRTKNILPAYAMHVVLDVSFI